MNKIILVFVFFLTLKLGFTQSVLSLKELNIKSKEYLLEKDYKNAVPLFKQAAEMGNAEAQYNYGVCFQQGIIVEKSDSIAHYWFLKSAEQGWKDSEYELALNYAFGLVVPKDLEKSFYWSLKCAWQMDPECMYNVIGCYKDGIGVAMNTDSMIYWAVKLASLDAPEDLHDINVQIGTTRLNLAMMYYTGHRVNKDLVKSYTWFSIYNERKKVFKTTVQEKNIGYISGMERELKDSEKARAKADAEKILGRKLSNFSNLLKVEF